ncbi:hypothetical protein K0M31_007918 [Melipona bicolor]|uniref:Uncharacterized protein n=1 Tax=Melipona bicolor TaxID=60889 RepID=A0AA40KWH1_9HYME|nr:hypothetical protein K0M31_007918 [Melipona bicolor]
MGSRDPIPGLQIENARRVGVGSDAISKGAANNWHHFATARAETYLSDIANTRDRCAYERDRFPPRVAPRRIVRMWNEEIKLTKGIQTPPCENSLPFQQSLRNSPTGNSLRIIKSGYRE